MSEVISRPGRSWAERLLGPIERVGNRLPDPLTLFVILAGVVVLASALASGLGWTVAHPKTGETLRAVNLLTAEGVRRMFTEAVKNFTGFAPLGVVLVAMLGLGVVERSGLIAAVLRLMVAFVPKWAMSGALVFAGVMSSLATDVGYVVVVPLGAVLFAGLGRHPLAGLAAAFAGVAGGFSANLFVTPLDAMLATITTESARLIEPGVTVGVQANWYFMIASTFLITLLGWWVTDKIVEPRLGRWDGDPAAEIQELSGREKVGVAASAATALLVLLGVGLLCLPDVGVLYAAGMERPLKPLEDAVVPIMLLLFFLPGLVYGLVTGSIRDDKTVAKMTADTMGTMGVYIVLAFAAAQFIAYFNWSNLGLMIAVTGADALKSAGLGGVPLLLSFLVVAATMNLFIGSASAKWALMGPVFVPMLMQMGFAPELVQAIYRVGDSTTNIITPLLPYFPIVIAFGQKYRSDLRIGTLATMMLPYSVAFLVGWALLLMVWMAFEIPLGPVLLRAVPM